MRIPRDTMTFAICGATMLMLMLAGCVDDREDTAASNATEQPATDAGAAPPADDALGSALFGTVIGP